MNALWIAVALLVAGFAGWPVTALVFRLARTIDDKADAAGKATPAPAMRPPGPVSRCHRGHLAGSPSSRRRGRTTANAGKPWTAS